LKSWHELELQYAKRLRNSSREERRGLYLEAYDAASKARALTMPEIPKNRTAGTSSALVNSLIRLCDSSECVLEVGCGRGYTCLKLAPHVAWLVGLDMSDSMLDEARMLLGTNMVSNVSILNGYADKLTEYFDRETFDKVISIDVHEHLHPEDAIAHLSEVHAVLRSKGRLIVVTPNRLTGPHDITRGLFPDATQPLGFHLNETTCSELVHQMKGVGFVRFRSLMPTSFVPFIPFDIIYPSFLFIWFEMLLPRLGRRTFMGRIVNRFSGIFLIAEKE
jgi:SAM-dependent methyltransferase